MIHTMDSMATMLLSMTLAPNRDEYVRPLTTQEFRRVEAAARASRYHSLGRLTEADISGLMLYLNLSEEEAYRVYTLLHREVQLTYAVDSFMRDGIEIVTIYDSEYPQRVLRRMGDAAPPCFFRCGSAELLDQPAIAIVGISGVKTTPAARESVEALVRGAVSRGYAVITGGELGLSRVAASAVAERNGVLLNVLGGGLREHVNQEGIDALIALNRGAAISLEHPDVMFTISHAIARNKVLFSLADAAFVFNTDGKRGLLDVLRNRYCDWVYAWNGYPGNQPLIIRGAVPFGNAADLDLDELTRHWNDSRSEQINMFDLL